MTLIVVGLPGSGKSTVAELLRERGFHVVELGDIWRELVKEAGIPFTDAKATREFTKELREKEGKDVYARHALKRIKDSTRPVVVMGLRSLYELEYLKSNIKDIEIIAIKAPFMVRYNRAQARSKPEDHKTLADFRWQETREKRGFLTDKKEEKFGVVAVMKQADYKISNTKDLAFLEKQLDKTLKMIDQNK